VFISLSDNIQETFGLALIEAMAASMPVVATDWDGCRDIVVHGETGFLVRTFMPGPDLGQDLALAYAAGEIDYDRYIGASSQRASVDVAELCDACLLLTKDVEAAMRWDMLGEGWPWRGSFSVWLAFSISRAGRRVISQVITRRRASRSRFGRDQQPSPRRGLLPPVGNGSATGITCVGRR
jgi:hypothetical protein